MEQCEQLSRIVKHFGGQNQFFCYGHVEHQLNLNLDDHAFNVLMNMLLEKEHIEKGMSTKADGQYYKVTPTGSAFINQTDYCSELRLSHQFQKRNESNEKLNRNEIMSNIMLAVFTICFSSLALWFTYQDYQSAHKIKDKKLPNKLLQQKVDTLQQEVAKIKLKYKPNN